MKNYKEFMSNGKKYQQRTYDLPKDFKAIVGPGVDKDTKQPTQFSMTKQVNSKKKKPNI